MNGALEPREYLASVLVGVGVLLGSLGIGAAAVAYLLRNVEVLSVDEQQDERQ